MMILMNVQKKIIYKSMRAMMVHKGQIINQIMIMIIIHIIMMLNRRMSDMKKIIVIRVCTTIQTFHLSNLKRAVINKRLDMKQWFKIVTFRLKLIILFHFSIIVVIFYIGISLDKKGINPILASIAALASFIFQIKKVKKMHSECVITHPLSMEGDCSLNNTKIDFQQI